MLLRKLLRLLPLLIIAGPLSAQAPARPLELPRDSAVSSALRQAVLPLLRRQTEWFDTTSQRRPLRFLLRAEGDSTAWRAFEREISDSLSLRPVIALDRSNVSLTIFRAQLRDSLFEGFVDIGWEFFCGTSRRMDEYGYSIRAVRGSDGSWQPFDPHNDTLLESFGCIVENVKPEKMPGATARMAWISERYPCPTVVPHSWVALDKSIGKGFSCSLVAMAAAVARPEFELACVRVTSYASIGSGVKATDANSWGVAFYGRNQPGVSVQIDPVSGETRIFPVVFSKESQAYPPCRK